MLKEIREKMIDGIEQLEKTLERNKDIAEIVIKDVGEEYQEHNGHSKMFLAISFLLQRINVPAIFATIASQKVVDITEKFIQARYDEMKEQGKI